MSYKIDTTIQQQVLQLIGWDEQQYTQFIYDCGLAYLQAVINDESEYIASFIRRNEIYWNWWKMNWEMRDQEFIEQCYGWDEGIASRVEVYKIINDPRTLAASIYLNGQVLQNSYAVMIEDLHKSVHRKKLRA